MAPSRLKLTMTVMSIGLAREAGGGCQHEYSLAKTSLMVSSFCGWASRVRRRRKPHERGGKPDGWLAARRNHGLT